MPLKAPIVIEPLRSALITAHDRRQTDGIEPLYALILGARRAGWSLGPLALCIGVTRETVRQWNLKAEEMYGDVAPVTVSPPPPPPQTKAEQVKANRAMTRLTAKSREEKALAARLPRLLELKAVAETLRGPSASSPEKAQASSEYTALINETLDVGVRASRLARALDVEVVTIYARLRRGGYRKPAPSEIAGRKLPSWSKAAREVTVQVPEMDLALAAS